MIANQIIHLVYMRSPSKQPAGRELSERVPCPAVADVAIRMRDRSRREKSGRAWGKLDCRAQLPQYEVSTFLLIEVAERSDRAPSVRQVGEVSVAV